MKIITNRKLILNLLCQFVFLLQILVSNRVYSQTPYTHYIPFPEDSAQWSVWYINSSTTSSVEYKMKGDSIINGISYNKIYKSYNLNFSSNDTLINCFVRQDTATKKVYARYPYSSYQDSSEFVLYDFSLQVGDTFMLKILPNHITYPAIMVASAISQYNFDFRRDQFMNVIDTCGLSYCLWGIDMDSQDWIEGMGSGQTPFYCEIPVNCCFNSTYNEQCFWHNNQYVFGGTFCSAGNGIHKEEEIINHFISLFPIPISGESSLIIHENGLSSIDIYDSYGSLINQNTTSEKLIKIQAELFTKGIYFLHYFNYKSGHSESLKFIIYK